jgi:exodeoxyribonuclease VII small subunit
MNLNANSSEAQKPDFTESVSALEEILEKFRSGDLSLEESLALFESGVSHLKVCQEKLSTARGRVDELIKTLQQDGESVTRPFEE